VNRLGFSGVVTRLEAGVGGPFPEFMRPQVVEDAGIRYKPIKGN